MHKVLETITSGELALSQERERWERSYRPPRARHGRIMRRVKGLFAAAARGAGKYESVTRSVK